MRLIDADELKKYTNSFVSAYGVKCAEMFQGVIDQTETACDIDEMVKELSATMGNGSGFEQGFQYALEEVKKLWETTNTYRGDVKFRGLK